MFRVLKNVELYAPEYMGFKDILTAYGKIALISDRIGSMPMLQAEVTDCGGMIAMPGLVDQHVHITGGGGEQGPGSMIEPIGSDELVMAGITTVVGVLGCDGVGRNMQGLLMKAKALETSGLTAFIYTGNYGIPPVTITGRVLTDLVMIDKVIGAGEIAISDHRSAYPTQNDLAKLAYEVITGGMIGGKAGVIHLHVGDGRDGLRPLTELLESTDFPISMFVPTHLNRNRALFDQTVRYHKTGGTIDLTAGEETEEWIGVPQCLARLVEAGNGLDRVTVSSDGNGSGAGGPGKGAGSVMSLFSDFRSAVVDHRLPLESVLRTVTENPAKTLKLYPRKGKIAVGSDADILLADRAGFAPKMLLAGGCLLMWDGKPVR
ncbi:MAG: beta-aspartyl-peptidase [Clostridiaceae bacterium]|jgi:beta-aspartyl-dipeptidase (metallo-type)|nr:beta-aspartyl-peptidase [Clostridiaceae bacterium]